MKSKILIFVFSLLFSFSAFSQRGKTGSQNTTPPPPPSGTQTERGNTNTQQTNALQVFSNCVVNVLPRNNATPLRNTLVYTCADSAVYYIDNKGVSIKMGRAAGLASVVTDNVTTEGDGTSSFPLSVKEIPLSLLTQSFAQNGMVPVWDSVLGIWAAKRITGTADKDFLRVVNNGLPTETGVADTLYRKGMTVFGARSTWNNNTLAIIDSLNVLGANAGIKGDRAARIGFYRYTDNKFSSIGQEAGNASVRMGPTTDNFVVEKYTGGSDHTNGTGVKRIATFSGVDSTVTFTGYANVNDSGNSPLIATFGSDGKLRSDLITEFKPLLKDTQALSISGSVLSLSGGGGSVTLPSGGGAVSVPDQEITFGAGGTISSSQSLKYSDGGILVGQSVLDIESKNYFTTTYNTAQTNNKYGLRSNVYIGSNQTSSFGSVLGYTVPQGSANITGMVRGVYGAVDNNSTGTLQTVYPFYSVLAHRTAGNIDHAAWYKTHGVGAAGTAGTITNLSGLEVSNFTSGNVSIGNFKGIYVEDMAGLPATNKWGLFIDGYFGVKNFIRGKTGIGYSVQNPGIQLYVQSVEIDSSIFRIENAFGSLEYYIRNTNPTNNWVAKKGTHFWDTNTSKMYYKTTNGGTSGWESYLQSSQEVNLNPSQSDRDQTLTLNSGSGGGNTSIIRLGVNTRDWTIRGLNGAGGYGLAVNYEGTDGVINNVLKLNKDGSFSESNLVGTGDRVVVANSSGVKTATVALSSLQKSMREQSFTATAGQTNFTISYTAPAVSGTSVPLRVYRNGVRLFWVASGPTSTQFTYTGATVTTSPNTLNDVITIEYLN